MKNKNNSKNKSVIFNILVLTALMLNFLSLSAQFGWETLYNSSQTTHGRKGCLPQVLVQKFASTGMTKTNGCLPQAYLMETNIRGVVNWTITLGEQDFYFEGLSVKPTADGGYVVVGKTTKNQTFLGPPTGSECEDYIPYYNAFIAYYNHTSPWLNWTQVFGNENLNDYATEVMEDINGNFVVTGIANEKFYGSCSSNSPFVYKSGYKSSKVLFSVFTSNGTNIINRAYGQDSMCYEARNIMQASNGDIIVTSTERLDNFNIIGFLPYFYTTNLLQFSPTYTFVNSHIYGTHFAIDRRPYQTIETPFGYLIGGEDLNYQQDAIWSYLIYTDFNFSILGFGCIRNLGYKGRIVLRDIELIDSFNYLVTGDYYDSLNTGLETDYFAMKIRWDGVNFYDVNSNVGNGNMAHYHVDNEKLANTVKYFNDNGDLRYHLFGNSRSTNSRFDQAYYVDVDANLQSGCEIWDSVDVGNIWMEHVQLSFWYDNLQLMTPFIIDSIPMLRIPVCDNYPYFVFENEESSQQSATNLNSNSIEKSISIYPNPAEKELLIQFDGTTLNGGLVSFKIYNSAGQVVQELNEVKIDDSLDVVSINTQEFSSGMYFGIIMNGDKIEMFKFIKQ